MAGHGLEDDQSVVSEGDSIVEIEDEILAFKLGGVVDEEECDPVVVRSGLSFESEGRRVRELASRVNTLQKRKVKTPGTRSDSAHYPNYEQSSDLLSLERVAFPPDTPTAADTQTTAA